MDIIHELHIETTPEKLFHALSTDDGIAAWWTKARTQPRVGGLNEFDFRGTPATFRIEKLEPGKVVGWTAEQVPPDWNGTRVLFEISATPGGPVGLRFSHTGFAATTPLVAFSSYVSALSTYGPGLLRSIPPRARVTRGTCITSSSTVQPWPEAARA